MRNSTFNSQLGKNLQIESSIIHFGITYKTVGDLNMELRFIEHSRCLVIFSKKRTLFNTKKSSDKISSDFMSKALL